LHAASSYRFDLGISSTNQAQTKADLCRFNTTQNVSASGVIQKDAVGFLQASTDWLYR
jgi:hypothetical protein